MEKPVDTAIDRLMFPKPSQQDQRCSLQWRPAGAERDWLD